MLKFKRAVAFLLFICTLITLFPMTAVGIFSAENVREDAMININSQLSNYKIGATVTITNDGYIGIPTEISLYYDTNKGTPSPGYMTTGGTPVIIYVVNTLTERIGTKSDGDIITSMLNRGYIVAVLDYKNNEKAVSPALDWSTQLLREKIRLGNYFDGTTIPIGEYVDTVVVPAGYDVKLNDVYFELDKHGTDGTLDKIVNVWNNDFRKYHANKTVKWVHSDGSQKAVQNDFDGNSPVWYSDSACTAEDANGQYTFIKFTKAETITDCVKTDGSAIDLNLYYHLIYPTSPANDVPVMTLFSSAGYLMSGAATTDRPQFNGFLFNGYAGAMFDYAWIPMGRNDHYGYFDGSSVDKGLSVTGDNQSYATYTFNSSQVATAAMRYTRYLSLSEHSTYRLDIDKIGSYGISKAAWATQLGSPILRENLITSGTDEEIALSVNNKINSFYQQLYLPGHHGETRFDNGITESYTTDGITIDGGELQPWAVYDGKEISSGAQIVYSCCGASVDYIENGYSPLFITENLSDQYSTAYNMQNILVNLCRTHDIPALWFEADIKHTFANGKDKLYGVDTYNALFDFCDYYLKDTSVSVAYISPLNGQIASSDSDITVKFIGEVSESEVEKIEIKANGSTVNGVWTSAYGDTEWTFTPSDYFGGAVYTLTVPSGLVGKNSIATEKSYTSSFTAISESSANISSPANIDTNGSFITFTVPELNNGDNQIFLRLNVINNAVNKLNIYKAASNGDLSGELIGSLKISGSGIYKYDITELLSENTVGDTVYFRIACESEASTVTTYTQDFSTLGDFTTKDYNSYETLNFDGEGTVKVVLNTNEGKFGGEHSFYEVRSVLQNTKFINSNGKVTESDLGRRLLIKIRLYDTVSRPIRFTLKSLTSESDGILDYNRIYYTAQTTAGIWQEFVIPYTVYEASYKNSSFNQYQSLNILVNSTGNTESEIYFDSFTVDEVFTDISIGNMDVYTTGRDDVITDYGVLPSKYSDASLYPFAIFSDGAFVDVCNTYGKALELAKKAMEGSNSAEILLRTDHTSVSANLKITTINGSLTLDLGGNTLTNDKNTLFEGSTSGYNGGYDTSVTVKNGTLCMSGGGIIVFESRSSYDKKIDFTFDRVKFDIAEGCTRDKLFQCWNDQAAYTGLIDISIALNDCEIDLTNRVSTFTALYMTHGSGSELVAGKIALNGGNITANTLDGLTWKKFDTEGDSLSYGKGSNGSYTTLTLPSDYTAESSNITAISSTYSGVYEAHGNTTVYELVTSALITEYGNIPSSAKDKTFVAFVDGNYIGGYDTWSAVLNEAKNDSYAGKAFNILLRKNHVSTSGNTKLCYIECELVLDLNGYTFENQANHIFEGGNGSYTDSATHYFSNITVKNGNILLSKKGGLIVFESRFSGLGGDIDVLFDNVSFKIAAEYERSSPALVNSYGDKSGITDVLNIDISFNNCEIDISEYTSSFKMFNYAAKTTIIGNIFFNGGNVTAASLDNLTWKSFSNSADALYYGKGSDGKYPTLTLPSAHTVTSSKASSISDLFVTTPKVIGESSVYQLVDTSSSRVTEYGIIPSSYSSTSSYPFVIFDERGVCIGTATTWGAATSTINTYLASNNGRTVYILMRKDTDSTSAATNMSTVNGSIVLDLGGHSLTRSSKTLFECELTSAYTTEYPTSILVKNGKIISKGGQLMSFKTAVVTPKTFNICFEDVKFELDASASFSSGKYYMFNRTWGGINEGMTTVNVTLNECVIDYTAYKSSGTLYLFESNRALIKSNITSIGTTIINASVDGSESPLTLQFVNGSYYSMIKKVGSKGYDEIYGIKSDLKITQTALRLYHDISMCFRLPVSTLSANGYTAPRLEIEFNGEKYFINGILSDGYYLFMTERISPESIGKTITYTLYATKDGVGAVGITFETSIKSYCYRALNTASVGKAEKKLIVDMLNYASAAQIWTSSTDELVNSELTEEQIKLGTDTDHTPSALEQNRITNDVTKSIIGMSYGLKNGIRIRISSNISTLKLVITAPSGEKTEIQASSFKVANDEIGGYFAYFNDASAAQLLTVYRFEIYDGYTLCDALSYSFEAFAYDTVNDASASDELKALVYKMMNYGRAAYAYCTGGN